MDWSARGPNLNATKWEQHPQKHWRAYPVGVKTEETPLTGLLWGPPLLLSSSTSGWAAQALDHKPASSPGPLTLAGCSAAGGYRSCAGGRAPPHPCLAGHRHCADLRFPLLSWVLAEPGSTWPSPKVEGTDQHLSTNLWPVRGKPRTCFGEIWPSELRAWGSCFRHWSRCGGTVNKIPVSMEHPSETELQGCMRHVRDWNLAGKGGPKETLRHGLDHCLRTIRMLLTWMTTWEVGRIETSC